jgi:hypothetical protein
MEEVESFLLLADRLLVNANVLAVSAQAARIKRRCTVAIADSAIVVRVVASLLLSRSGESQTKGSQARSRLP